MKLNCGNCNTEIKHEDVNIATDLTKFINVVADNVTLLTTAYKGDQPYFALTKLSIKPTQTISYTLEQKSIQLIKEALEEKI